MFRLFLKENRNTILCVITLSLMLGLSFMYGTKLDSDLKDNAVNELQSKSPEQLEEIKNMSDKEFLSQLNVEGDLVYFDDSVSINAVDTVLNCFVNLPKDLQRLVQDCNFKIKLTQFIDGVDGVTFYADRVLLIEEFGDNITNTVYHEFGHIVHALGDIQNNANRLGKVYKLESVLYTGDMREYITSSPSEYYAGSFVDYMLDPDKLERERPETFKIIDKDIKSLKNIDKREANKHLDSYIKFGEYSHE